MGGINIHCPPFVGRDKSGTPFEAVLAEISEGADLKSRMLFEESTRRLR